MATFSLSDVRNKHGEVFDVAMTEPVLVTKNSRPSHVVCSAKLFSSLTERLRVLEEMQLGDAAAKACYASSLVGAKEFTAEMKRLAKI